MTAKPKVELPPLVRDFLSITLLVMPGALLMVVWAGAMWFLLKQPDSTSTKLQGTPPQSSPSSSSSSTAFPDLLLALGMGSLFVPSNSTQPTPFEFAISDNLSIIRTSAKPPQPPQEKSNDPQSKVEDLSDSNSDLKKQLDEIKTANSADDKVYDLVIAALSSLVAVAVIVPSVTVISKAISDKHERSQIKNDIQEELRKEFDRQLGEINNYLALKDYETASLSISRAIGETRINEVEYSIGDTKHSVKITSKDWGDSNSILIAKIQKIPDSKLRELKIHRYPLILRDISKALQARKHLYVYALDDSLLNNLDASVEQQLELFLFLLVLMTYAHEDKDKYVLPRLSKQQIEEFGTNFENLDKYFDRNRPKTKCGKVIKQIRDIIRSHNVRKDFVFFA